MHAPDTTRNDRREAPAAGCGHPSVDPAMAAEIIRTARTKFALRLAWSWRLVARRLVKHFGVDAREAFAQLDALAGAEFDGALERALAAASGAGLVEERISALEVIALFASGPTFSEELRVLDVEEPTAGAAGDPVRIARLSPSRGLADLLAAFAALDGEKPVSHSETP